VQTKLLVLVVLIYIVTLLVSLGYFVCGEGKINVLYFIVIFISLYISNQSTV